MLRNCFDQADAEQEGSQLVAPACQNLGQQHRTAPLQPVSLDSTEGCAGCSGVGPHAEPSLSARSFFFPQGKASHPKVHAD